MNVILMVFYLAVALGALVFIHEGGHFLAARAFGVRVTEFMLGLPGPSIGFTWRGTRFGVTAVPLGGYAKVCGMEPGPENPHMERALAFISSRGTVYADDFAAEAGITTEEAVETFYALEEWDCGAPLVVVTTARGPWKLCPNFGCPGKEEKAKASGARKGGAKAKGRARARSALKAK